MSTVTARTIEASDAAETAQSVVGTQDVRASWAVKKLPRSDRLLATQLAVKLDMSNGELVSAAIRHYADKVAGNAVLPPKPRQAPQAAAEVDRSGLMLDQQAQLLTATLAAMREMPGRQGAAARRAARQLCLGIENDARVMQGLSPRLLPSPPAKGRILENDAVET